uniref:ZF(C2H2)-26 zinc finger protein n=1 Tax=Phallusia mammillata TaxID=59560 RepID=A0A6F9DWV0_9ASCI|nr:ZF(C2H2)-26 zinc finger protein [Phallusia mammillata]
MQSYFESLSGPGTAENLSFLENTSALPDGRQSNLHQVSSHVHIPPGTSSLSVQECQNPVIDNDESDIFQCGRCKQQFNSLEMFFQHKNTPCMTARQQHVCPATPIQQHLLTEDVSNVNNRIEANYETNDIGSLQSISINEGSQLNQLSVCVPSHNTNGQTESPFAVPAPITHNLHCIGSLSSVQTHQQNVSSNTMTNRDNIIRPSYVEGQCASSSTCSVTIQQPARIVMSDDLLLNAGNVARISNNEAMNASNGIVDHELTAGNGLISSLLDQIPPYETSQNLSALQTHGNNQQTSTLLQLDEECSTYLQMPMMSKNQSILPTLPKSRGKSLETILPKLYDKTSDNNRPTQGFSDATLPASTSLVSSLGTSHSLTMAFVDSKKKFKCHYCNKMFAKNFDLEQHTRSHTGEKPFQCIVCGRAFAQKSNVKKHMISHKVWLKGKKSFPQHFSKETETNTEEKQNDSSVVADEEVVSFVCEYCGKSFKSYNKRKSHMKEHKDKQVYKCLKEECSSTFVDLDKFVEHVKSHETGMTYRCHQCHKVFKSLHDLGVHQYQVHLNSKRKNTHTKMYACTLCPSKFSHPTALREHMNSDPHKYVCKMCNASFTCERYLRKHYLLQHKGKQGTQEAKCTECGKILRSVYYLRLHMLIHTKELPYHCTKCDAAFNRKDKVKRHMLTHDTIKRFKCPLKSVLGCTKEFNRADKLKDHIISHSGVKKSFACSFCSKTYSRLSSKIKHEKAHSSNFYCGTCLRGFDSESNFKQHKCRKPVTAKSASVSATRTKRRKNSIKKIIQPQGSENHSTGNDQDAGCKETTTSYTTLLNLDAGTHDGPTYVETTANLSTNDNKRVVCTP